MPTNINLMVLRGVNNEFVVIAEPLVIMQIPKASPNKAKIKLEININAKRIFTNLSQNYSEIGKIEHLVPEVLEQLKNYLQTNFSKNQIYKELEGLIGFYGFVSFEFAKLITNFNFSKKQIISDYLFLVIPNVYVVYDNEQADKNGKYFSIFPQMPIANKIQNFAKNINHKKNPVNDNCETRQNIPTTPYIPNTTYPQYQQYIIQCLKYINQGDIYQANITHEFYINKKFTNKNLREFFMSKFLPLTAPYKAFIESPQINILSASPELFLEISNGQVRTKPIKGTVARLASNVEDKKNILKLKNSAKDRAELSMIVDLLRNDLGRSALPNTVKVDKHCALESFNNVHHLVSTISAKITTDIKSAWRLFLRAFPAGSISGCPKVRALEIIDELEKSPRGVYTGAIGYLAINGDSIWNVAIRTIQAVANKNNKLIIGSGGGIVLDSNPQSEYIESLHKVRHLLAMFNTSANEQIYWLNGEFIHRAIETKTKKKTISQINNHKQGCFESIRVKNALPQNLHRHYLRCNKALKKLKIKCKLPSEKLLTELIAINQINSGRVRIAIAPSTDKANLLIEIFNYQEPENINLLLTNKYFSPLNAMVEGIKSTNYQRYRKRINQAISNNCFDNILFDSNNFVIEGSRCNIYSYINNKWITPKDKMLVGTVQKILIDNGLVEKRNFTVPELITSEEICISNALIGVRRVEQIIGMDKKILWSTKTKINANKLISNYTRLG